MPGNDAWGSATSLTGTSGSGSDDLYGATLETDEPPLDASAWVGAGSLWYTFTPTSPGTLNFTATNYAITVDLWSGGSLTELVQQDIDTTGNVSAVVAAGVPVYIRVYSQVPIYQSAPFNYSYNFIASTNDLLITLVSDCPTSPGNVLVHVGNLALGDTVDFYIDNSGTPALVEQVPAIDTDGITVGDVYYIPAEEQLLFCGVPVSSAYGKGTHTLQITSSPSGLQATVSFLVLAGPASALSSGSDAPPSIASGNKFVFMDPAPGGETYIWEFNPLTMSTPFADKVITEDHTTAADGQPLEWEATQKATQWNLSGTLFNQGQLDAFVRFARLDRRIWLRDHLQRSWLVTIEELDAEPRASKGTTQYPWIHDWKMTLLVWKGPVT